MSQNLLMQAGCIIQTGKDGGRQCTNRTARAQHTTERHTSSSAMRSQKGSQQPPTATSACTALNSPATHVCVVSSHQLLAAV